MYSSASRAALRFSSSLYLLAALEVYLTLASLLASAALPPLDWKNFVADSLPPTFIVRSWLHCHTVQKSMHALRAGLYGYKRTVQIGRSDKRDMDTEIPVVRGTVETKVDSEWHRRPCRVLLTAIKTYLD